MTAAHFHHGKIPKDGVDSAAYKHFQKLLPGSVPLGLSVVRCLVTKHTSCRQRNCAVKKSVQCHSICERTKKAATLDRKLKANVASHTEDCGEGGKKLCDGYYTDTNGAKQSFGAFACRQVAMMA